MIIYGNKKERGMPIPTFSRSLGVKINNSDGVSILLQMFLVNFAIDIAN